MKAPKKSRIVARTWPLWWVDCWRCDQRFRWEWGWVRRGLPPGRRGWRCVCSTCAPTEEAAEALTEIKLPDIPPPVDGRPLGELPRKPAAPPLRNVQESPLGFGQSRDFTGGGFEVVDSPRPEPEDEDRVITAAYREALERISRALRMPGSPDLTSDVPREVECRLLGIAAAGNNQREP